MCETFYVHTLHFLLEKYIEGNGRLMQEVVQSIRTVIHSDDSLPSYGWVVSASITTQLKSQGLPAAFERYPSMQLHPWPLPPATLVSPARRPIFSSRGFYQVLPAFFPVSQTGNSLKTCIWGSGTLLIHLILRESQPSVALYLISCKPLFYIFCLFFFLFHSPPSPHGRVN